MRHSRNSGGSDDKNEQDNVYGLPTDYSYDTPIWSFEGISTIGVYSVKSDDSAPDMPSLEFDSGEQLQDRLPKNLGTETFTPTHFDHPESFRNSKDNDRFESACTPPSSDEQATPKSDADHRTYKVNGESISCCVRQVLEKVSRPEIELEQKDIKLTNLHHRGRQAESALHKQCDLKKLYWGRAPNQQMIHENADAQQLRCQDQKAVRDTGSASGSDARSHAAAACQADYEKASTLKANEFNIDIIPSGDPSTRFSNLTPDATHDAPKGCVLSWIDRTLQAASPKLRTLEQVRAEMQHQQKSYAVTEDLHYAALYHLGPDVSPRSEVDSNCDHYIGSDRDHCKPGCLDELIRDRTEQNCNLHSLNCTTCFKRQACDRSGGNCGNFSACTGLGPHPYVVYDKANSAVDATRATDMICRQEKTYTVSNKAAKMKNMVPKQVRRSYRSADKETLRSVDTIDNTNGSVSDHGDENQTEECKGCHNECDACRPVQYKDNCNNDDACDSMTRVQCGSHASHDIIHVDRGIQCIRCGRVWYTDSNSQENAKGSQIGNSSNWSTLFHIPTPPGWGTKAHSVLEQVKAIVENISAGQNPPVEMDVQGDQWTTEQDQELLALRSRRPFRSWSRTGNDLGKSASQCKERFNIIRPNGLAPRSTNEQQENNFETKKQNMKSETSSIDGPQIYGWGTGDHFDNSDGKNDIPEMAMDCWATDGELPHRETEGGWGEEAGPSDACGNIQAAGAWGGNSIEDLTDAHFESGIEETGWGDNCAADGCAWDCGCGSCVANKDSRLDQGSDQNKTNDLYAAAELEASARTTYHVTYWATVKCGDQTGHIPIDSSNISGPEKIILDGPAKKVWKWVHDKGLGDRIGLQDAFDLAKDMQGDDDMKADCIPKEVGRSYKARAPSSLTSNDLALPISPWSSKGW